MASLPLSLHSPSGRGGAAREVGRSDLRKKREQKRLAHTHKSDTLTSMLARVDMQRKKSLSIFVNLSKSRLEFPWVIRDMKMYSIAYLPRFFISIFNYESGF